MNAVCGLCVEDDPEDRRERRERAVDQPDHRGLHALQEEALLVRHGLECTGDGKCLDIWQTLQELSGGPDVRLKLTVAYDGTGFQRLRAAARETDGRGRAVSGDRRALWAADALAVAGRTDNGVHALANVVSVEVAGRPPPERAAEALNAVLPDDLAVVSAEAAARRFHARFDARSRSYRYRICGAAERSPFEARRAFWHPRAARSRRAARGGRSAARRARLPCVHSDRDAARRLRPDGRDGAAGWSSTTTCSSSRSRPTRSCATWCARSSERCSRAATSRRSSPAARAATRARPPRRTACTSRHVSYCRSGAAQ